MPGIDNQMSNGAAANSLPWRAEQVVALDSNGPQNVEFRLFQDLWIERPALELFAGMVARHPDRTACEDIDGALTFAELWAGARRLAHTIDAAVRRDGAVGILLPNQASYPVAVLACLGAARPAVLIDRHYPQDRVAAIVRDAGCVAMILNASDIAGGYLLPADVHPLALEDALSGEVPERMPADPLPPDAPSFIVYTSGSTGQPKGIVLSQRAVLHRASELVNAVHLNPHDKVLSLASPGTIGGLQQIFEVMLSGASLVKLDLQRLGLGQVVRTIAERQISMMFSTPAVWRSVSRLPGARQMLGSLRCVQSSGDALLRMDYDLMRAVLADECHILSVYGATEAPALIQWFIADPPADEVRVPAGYPLPGIELAVVDELGRPMADGEPGELVIRSRFTSLGVWQRGQVMPGALQTDQVSDGLKVYRTGDLVRRRPDGLYVVLGRRDRQIKVLGNRVELAEIETALRQAPGVLDGAVVARRGDGEPAVIGFFVPRERGDPLLTDKVRQHLDETLPAFMRPRSLLELDSLPLLPGRKIDEDALLARAAAASGPAGTLPKAGDARRADAKARAMVDKAWRTALGKAPPPGQVTFEEAGGDSLQLLQLVFELERLAGQPLPMERFHGRQSVEDIGAELDNCLGEATETLPADAAAIFLFPPSGGGGAHFMAFRTACGAHTIVRQVRYPDLRELARSETSFETIAAHAARQVESLKAEGPLILAGYSAGGEVAYAAARQLQARGRVVERLILLDTDASGLSYPLPSVQAASPQPVMRRYFRRPTIHHYRRLVDMAMPVRFLRTAQGRALLSLMLALRLRLPLPAEIAIVASLRAYDILFDECHRRWLMALEPAPLDIPTVLFRSQEQRPGAPEDLGWRRRTRELSIIPVNGDHFTMLEGTGGVAIARECARLARAFRTEFGTERLTPPLPSEKRTITS